MCQSSVWARYPDGQMEKIADDVLHVTQEGNEVLLRWFLKEPLRFSGRILAVDAVKHTILLETSEQRTDEEKPHVDAEPIEAAYEHTHPHQHPHPSPH